MTIVHIVTYISEDGAFGGPLSVAREQLTALESLGYEVELRGGWDRKANIAAQFPVRLRAVVKGGRGFRYIFSPSLFKDVLLERSSGNVFHVHMGRDLVTLPVALLLLIKKQNYVVQTHGMIMEKDSPVIKLLDRLITRRVLSGATRVLALTEAEVRAISSLSEGEAKITMTPNGIDLDQSNSSQDRIDRRIVFLARLHPRKRVLAFAEMCKILVERGVGFEAVIYGPDEGDLSSLNSYISSEKLSDRLRYLGAAPNGTARGILSAAGVFVLPSRGEIYPMTILEALAVQTPVVTTTSSGLAGILDATRAALVTDGSPEALADAVEQVLNDTEMRAKLVERGSAAAREVFDIRLVADVLVKVYESSRTSTESEVGFYHSRDLRKNK